MTLNRYVRLKRGDKASIVQMMKDCRRVLSEGNSIMMFPEGTRSPNGRLRRFKTGAFDLARQANLPILPIVLEGTSNALPKRGFVLQGRHPIHVKILDEIPPEDFARGEVEALTDQVRDLIATHLEEERKGAPSPAQATG